MKSTFVYYFSVYCSALRPTDWRYSFVPFVAGINYLCMLLFSVKLDISSLSVLFLFLLSSVGFASLGYFINEFFDIPTDRVAQKVNKLVSISNSRRVFFLLGILLFTFLPWIYLPSDKWSWTLISIELLLFLAYSFPFPRLKNVWFLSGIIDSIYAYVIPIFLSFNTYMLYSGNIYRYNIFLISGAFFFVGYRNIVLHQINDIDFDKRSGIITLPIKVGKYNTKKLLSYILLVEILLLSIYIYSISLSNKFFWAILSLYILHVFINIIIFYKEKLFNTTSFPFLFTNKFYHVFSPLIYIILLLFNDYRWILILFLHFMFLISFEEKKHLFVSVRNAILNIIHFGIFISSVIVNYSIYYLFLLFNVDLIKEKKSAIEYLKNKKN